MWLCAALAGLAAVWLVGRELRGDIVQGLLRLSPAAVAIALTGQALSTALCAAALRDLAPGATYGTALRARWVRDGVSNLLGLVPGAGEAAGVRVMTAAGAPLAAAAGATAADALAETVAQALYTAAAFAWAPVLLPFHIARLDWTAVTLAAAAILALVLAGLSAPLRSWAWRQARKARQSAAAYAMQVGAVRAVGAVLLHLAAWMVGGLQLWGAAWAMGLRLGLGPAVCLEALTYASRGMFFFVPAGVGVQDVAMTALAVAFGLDLQSGVVLALLLRVRDAALGLPGLALWLGREIISARRLGRLAAPALNRLRPGSQGTVL